MHVYGLIESITDFQAVGKTHPLRRKVFSCKLLDATDSSQMKQDFACHAEPFDYPQDKAQDKFREASRSGLVKRDSPRLCSGQALRRGPGQASLNPLAQNDAFACWFEARLC